MIVPNNKLPYKKILCYLFSNKKSSPNKLTANKQTIAPEKEPIVFIKISDASVVLVSKKICAVSIKILKIN